MGVPLSWFKMLNQKNKIKTKNYLANLMIFMFMKTFPICRNIVKRPYSMEMLCIKIRFQYGSLNGKGVTKICWNNAWHLRWLCSCILNACSPKLSAVVSRSHKRTAIHWSVYNGCPVLDLTVRASALGMGVGETPLGKTDASSTGRLLTWSGEWQPVY